MALKAGVGGQTIYQIVAGVLLPSGKERGVGRDVAAKLDVAYPGWRTLGPDDRPSVFGPDLRKNRLMAAYEELNDDERDELVNLALERAAKAIGNRALAEKFGVKNYTDDGRVAEFIKPAPTAKRKTT